MHPQTINANAIKTLANRVTSAACFPSLKMARRGQARGQSRQRGRDGDVVPPTLKGQRMFHVLHRSDQRKGAIAAVEFEGMSYNAGASFFLGDLAPGRGPTLHKHPYSEICIIRSGQARMTIDKKKVVAGPGDIIVIEPVTPHGFTAIGDERLEIICIHVSDRFIIEGVNN